MKLTVACAFVLGALASAGALVAQCQPHMGPPPGPPPKVDGPAPGAASSGSPSGPRASGPSSPHPAGPGAPSAPGSNNPTTGGGNSAPTTPRSGGPRTGRGSPNLAFERQETANDRLRVDWIHPVPPTIHQEGTAVASALPLGDVLDVLWGTEDDRPLLVLRECSLCQGSDNALLSRSLNNDRTMLLLKWFRTVRLPAHVTEHTHPFFNLFQNLETKEGVPHIFLLAHPGAKPVVFDGQQTQGDLWRGLYDVLGQRYAKDAQRAVKEWLALLDKFDVIDGKRAAMQEQLAGVRAEDGPDSTKAKKLEVKLKANEQERTEALATEAKIRDLGLLRMPRLAAIAAPVK